LKTISSAARDLPTAVLPGGREFTTAARMAVPTAEPKGRPTAVLREGRGFTTAVPTAAPKGRPMAARRVNRGFTMEVPTGALTAEPIADPLFRITGLKLEEFGARYWDAAPLVATAAQLPGDGFDDLLSLGAVDELVSQRGLRTPFVRMSRDGELVSSSRFTRSGGAGAEISDQVADDSVLVEFEAGATLVLQALHRTWFPIQTFARELSAQLGHPVQVNAYVTPPQNAGFAPHYDVHDVFVLQFAGRKRWRIYEPVLNAPLRDQPWQERRAAVEARAAQTPLIDRVLERGDVLYLPRGYIHAATSLEEISGHLTIGVHPVTRRMLADHALASLCYDAELRRSLPIGVNLCDEKAIETDFAATIAALRTAIDRLDRKAAASGIAKYLASAMRPAAIAPFDQIAASAELAPERRVRLRPGLRVLVHDGSEQVVIALPDREVALPAVFGEAARVAASGSSVSAAELPGINTEQGMALLATLLRAGVLVPV
jgi:ribosomal protein L16 Arg81 hydroxylase